MASVKNQLHVIETRNFLFLLNDSSHEICNMT